LFALAAADSTDCPEYKAQALLWLIDLDLYHTPPVVLEQLTAGTHCWKPVTQGIDVLSPPVPGTQELALPPSSSSDTNQLSPEICAFFLQGLLALLS